MLRYSGSFSRYYVEYLMNLSSRIDFPVILSLLTLLSLFANSFLFDNHSKLVNGKCRRSLYF